MDKILLKPVESEVHYQVLFTTPAFALLANPVPLYENILKRLSKYGANLNSIAIETGNLANTNAVCTLFNLNAVVRFRLERLEISFMRAKRSDEPSTKEIFLDALAVINETPGAPIIKDYLANVHFVTEIQNFLYKDVVSSFVNSPKVFGDKIDAGVAFYTPEDSSKGERQGSVVIDRVAGIGRGLDLRIAGVFDANIVKVEMVSDSVDNFVNRQIDNLGFVLVVEKNT